MRPKACQMSCGPNLVMTKTDNIIFVFGSNLAGRHGKGAALTAVRLFDAKYGVGVGPTGKAYAIPTKDERLRTLPLASIQAYVDEFKSYAKEHPELQFFVTPIGTGLAGYKNADIAPMFYGCPENCDLPPLWRKILESLKKLREIKNG